MISSFFRLQLAATSSARCRQRYAFSLAFSPVLTQFQSLSSQPNAVKLPVGIRTRARSLLDEQTNPLGSYTASQYNEALDALGVFRHMKATDAESVQLSIGLIERLVKEIARSKFKFDETLNWLTDPRKLPPFFNNWKIAAIAGERVFSPRELIQKLQKMLQELPGFRYNITTAGIIMEVLIKQEHPRNAPLVAEQLLDFIQKEAVALKNTDLLPNVVIYSQLLKAWTDSGLPQTPQRIDEILRRMREQGIRPNVVKYNILLRYWAGKGSMERIEAIMQDMKNEAVKPNLLTLSQAIYGYAKVGNTEKAEFLLQQMLLQHKHGDQNESKLIGESVQDILLAYVRMVESTPDKAVQGAEKLTQKMGSHSLLDLTRISKLWMEKGKRGFFYLKLPR